MIDRRQFVGSGLLGLSALGATNLSATESSKTYREHERLIPVVEDADVIVCGGGPAGVAAALAAARTGASVRLIEVNGCLGGIWTAGLLCWILDTKDKPGILVEIMDELTRRGAGYQNGTSTLPYAYDPEIMKLILEELCMEAGINIRLHTRLVDAGLDENKRLKIAVTESKSGREAWRGKVFIDATGDGDLAARAGCKFDMGREEDGHMQPFTMFAMITGVDYENFKEFVRGKEKDPSATKQRLFDEIKQGGLSVSYRKPVLFRIYDDLYCLGINHEYGYSGIDANDVTQATLHARKEIHQAVNALRSLQGRWKNLKVVATNEQIGIREARRIHGHYTVSSNDLLNGVSQKDSVCKVYFGVDVHPPKFNEGKNASFNLGIKSKPYDIPLRALIARDVDGLLTAGRCISGDFIAHSSYRVTGNSVALGQAAGVTAALAVQSDLLPQNIAWEKIQKGIEKLNAT